MNAIRVGTYVTHSQRPAWGVGKVFGQSQQHVLVGFSALPEAERFKRLQWRIGLLERADVRQDAELDSWKVDCDSTCHYIGAVEKPKRATKAPQWTREEAMERFLNKYSGGFPDAWYRSSSRNDLVVQHDAWNNLLGGASLRNMADSDPHIAGQSIIRVFEATSKPLLHKKTELPRLVEAMDRGESLRPFLIALADLLDAERPTAPLYTAYVESFAALAAPGRATPLTWSIVSAIPFIARPESHMHMRPTPTRRAALGLGFDLKFNARPNWVTYERLLKMSNDLLEFIKPRSGVDMIDVHAFIAATAS